VPPSLAGQWCSHEDWVSRTKKNGWHHYNTFDDGARQFIWRFSSKPISECIFIAAGESIGSIIEVIGKHSGGGDKTNTKVVTSSFCRNVGALLGTAASAGGDKNVLHIINKSAYLCCIDLASLAAKGVSAHPALARAISLFETEYVLVPTPGEPKVSIAELATAIYPNPFKDRIQLNGEITNSKVPVAIGAQGAYELVSTLAKEKPAVEAEVVEVAEPMPNDKVESILRFAGKSSLAATRQASVVRDKELTSFPLETIMAQYTKDLG
jgi:hypothetical protein